MKKKRRGAPKGNQNARRHGFYSTYLTNSDALDFKRALVVDGLDQEIALLRVKLKNIVVDHPEHLELALDAASAIGRLVKAKYTITNEQKQSMKDAITKVMVDIATPLGVKVIIT